MFELCDNFGIGESESDVLLEYFWAKKRSFCCLLQISTKPNCSRIQFRAESGIYFFQTVVAIWKHLVLKFISTAILWFQMNSNSVSIVCISQTFELYCFILCIWFKLIEQLKIIHEHVEHGTMTSSPIRSMPQLISNLNDWIWVWNRLIRFQGA